MRTNELSGKLMPPETSSVSGLVKSRVSMILSDDDIYRSRILSLLSILSVIIYKFLFIFSRFLGLIYGDEFKHEADTGILKED